MSPVWSYVLGAVGLTGLYLSGKKLWWSWYINLGAQALWLAYSIITQQYGFLIATFGYIYVFGTNARKWTKEHRNEQRITALEEESLVKPRDVHIQGNPYVNIYTTGGGSVRVPMHYLIKLWKEQHDATGEGQEGRASDEAQGEPRQAQD